MSKINAHSLSNNNTTVELIFHKVQIAQMIRILIVIVCGVVARRTLGIRSNHFVDLSISA